MSRKIEVKKGDRYGMLTILEEVEPHIQPSGQKKRRVLVQCDCGSEPFEVMLKSLRSGDTSSCGCYMIQRSSEANSKTNKYEFEDDIVIGICSNGTKFYFDREDYELVKNFCWCIDNNGYVMTVDRTTGKAVKLHRLVMNAAKDEVVDHINHRPTDNRKSNLRICSQSDNVKNKSIMKNNTTGVTGIHWNKSRNQWQTYISVNGKLKHLGYFTSKAEAIRTRIKTELEIFGEYAPTYFCFTDEQRKAILKDEVSGKDIMELLKLNQDVEQYM